MTSDDETRRKLMLIGWPPLPDAASLFAAVKDFQRGYTPWNLLVDGLPGPQTHHALDVSIYYGGACGSGFLYREFASRGNGWIRVHRDLVRGLVRYRERYGPTRIVSGYRDPAHNGAVGGARNSQHLYGNAADLVPKASIAAVRNLRMFSGIGVQRASGLVLHVDVRHVGPNTTNGTVDRPTVWYYG